MSDSFNSCVDWVNGRISPTGAAEGGCRLLNVMVGLMVSFNN